MLLAGIPGATRGKNMDRTAISFAGTRGTPKAVLRGAAHILAYLVLFASIGTVAAAANNSDSWRTFTSLIAKTQRAMMTDPGAALETARASDAIARSQAASPRYADARATALWLEAEALDRIGRLQDARPILDQAARFAGRDGTITTLDGNVQLTRARIADASGDIALALKSYQTAHTIFLQLGIPRSQSIALQGLGMLYDKAHDFNRAIRYYRQASQIYSGDRSLELTAANNIGFALLQMGRYHDAIEDFRRALKIAASLKSSFLEAHIVTNIAISEARLHNLVQAERDADRTLALLGRKDENGESRFVWGVKAEIDYQRGAFAAAASDLEKTFHGLDLKTTAPAFRAIHEIAYRVYRAEGNLPLAIAHLEAFKRLDDQGRSLAASANLALMSARFDFAAQQFEIEQLKSAQLQRDIKLKEARATSLNIVFAALLLAGAALIIWILWRIRMERRHRAVVAQKNENLKQTLAARNHEIARRIDSESQLRVAMETAQQANLAKSHFLANMSHELRTPLNAIIGFSEMIGVAEMKTEKVREYASIITEGGRRLLGTLTDILDMARLEAGRIELQESTVRLSDMVENTLVVLASEEAAKRNIRLAPDNHDICVRADEVRLCQILTNLLSNAVKFTDYGGLIDVAIERVSDGVDLVVRDNGHGIPADKIAVIMEPFGQAESAYARSHGGVGLGLPLVKSLMALHGGTFTITSTVGQGTEARAHIPRERVTADAHAHSSLPRGLALSSTAVA